jgi:hypothetical protein
MSVATGVELVPRTVYGCLRSIIRPVRLTRWQRVFVTIITIAAAVIALAMCFTAPAIMILVIVLFILLICFSFMFTPILIVRHRIKMIQQQCYSGMCTKLWKDQLYQISLYFQITIYILISVGAVIYAYYSWLNVGSLDYISSLKVSILPSTIVLLPGTLTLSLIAASKNEITIIPQWEFLIWNIVWFVSFLIGLLILVQNQYPFIPDSLLHLYTTLEPILSLLSRILLIVIPIILVISFLGDDLFRLFLKRNKLAILGIVGSIITAVLLAFAPEFDLIGVTKSMLGTAALKAVEDDSFGTNMAASGLLGPVVQFGIYMMTGVFTTHRSEIK